VKLKVSLDKDNYQQVPKYRKKVDGQENTEEQDLDFGIL
jgi:hypothetical protein